ncbi:BaiN/RdsA family NAD(P)/FAD-dependent oxidoreductase [Methanofollis fontis]|uniref:NAD(P)/FAD-dependent oxidoreductase n=1 Tax=Methanofollis fontis TaxID=2052832 RepID=A0A483CPB0_9EURY|nr:NAD(P)/FAD-dependent oxidoreductase [Methanofollis fontis]TAJ43948.1 NAD(P)/FAD-dependent oxidoreductase [Methanofollis fontis]
MDRPAVVVIGGGPAGLFCALRAAEGGLDVLLLEKKPLCGRKLLVTGSGQCNLTHEGSVRDFLPHYGDNGAFLKPALMNFTNRDLITFFEERGLPTGTDAGGKIFPASRRAADVLSVLLEGCRRAGVEICSGAAVRAVGRDEDGFVVETESATIHCDALVVATGGASYPATGSTGDGYGFARAFGHTIAPIGPALASIEVEEYPFAGCAGISFSSVTLALFRGGKKVREVSGDLLFTHTGLSGPAVLHLSRYLLAGDGVRVSFLTPADGERLAQALVEASAAHGTRQVKTVLAGFPLPERFLRQVLLMAEIDPALPCAHLSRAARNRLIALLTGWTCGVAAVEGLDTAMVTRGGVSLAEVNRKTMESGLVPGLFFIGEVLDIDGDTGGYNLQAAFSTAALAARRLIEVHRTE